MHLSTCDGGVTEGLGVHFGCFIGATMIGAKPVHFPVAHPHHGNAPTMLQLWLLRFAIAGFQRTVPVGALHILGTTVGRGGYVTYERVLGIGPRAIGLPHDMVAKVSWYQKHARGHSKAQLGGELG